MMVVLFHNNSATSSNSPWMQIVLVPVSAVHKMFNVQSVGFGINYSQNVQCSEWWLHYFCWLLKYPNNVQCWCFDNLATSRRRCLLSLSNCKYCHSPENVSQRGQCSNWGEAKLSKLRGGNVATGGAISCKYKSQNISQRGQRSKRNCADENSMQILPIRELVSG